MKTSDWLYHQPLDVGEEPKDYRHGDEVEMYDNLIQHWKPLQSNPQWIPLVEYRYRTRAVTPSQSSLTEDDAARNELPMFDGLIAYFPNALAYVSMISKVGNDQHNPGEPLHWARGKSTDHLNKAVRHLVDAGKKDARGVRHSGRLAWRALANLQEELEREEGAPLARGAKL